MKGEKIVEGEGRKGTHSAFCSREDIIFFECYLLQSIKQMEWELGIGELGIGELGMVVLWH